MITDRNRMICKVCVSQTDKIFLKNPPSPMAFINDRVNFKKSTLNEHSSLECHNKGIAEFKHEQSVADGKSLPAKHVVHKVTADSVLPQECRRWAIKKEWVLLY